MSKTNKKLIEEIDLTIDQEAPASTGITLQAGLDRTIKALDTVTDRADNNEGDIIELNEGSFDVKGDGSKITKIFDANGDLNVPHVAAVTHTANEGFKGEHADITTLPTTGNVEGDYAFVGAKGNWLTYSWIGSSWEETGPGPSAGANAVDENRLLRVPTNQSTSAGIDAGLISQAGDAVAIGYNAAKTNQGDSCVAIGYAAGRDNQGANSIAIGYGSGLISQGDSSIAIGSSSGNSNQGITSVAIGTSAGSDSQGAGAVAIGYGAGQNDQGDNSIAIGLGTGSKSHPKNSIAIGNASKTAKEGDIVIETSNTANNNNKFEVKDGKIYVNDVEIGAGGGGSSWTDITSDYQTRVWTADDVGKQVRLTNDKGIATGFLKTNKNAVLPNIYADLGGESALSFFRIGIIHWISTDGNQIYATTSQYQATNIAYGIISKFEIKE